MNESPMFFVPTATSENQESVYANCAKSCSCPIPKLEDRIYSVTFIHDGEEWTATVGEHLRGIRKITSRLQGKKVERTKQLSDQAIVLAIFPGSPYIVVTNHRIGENVGSAWENPFYVGEPVFVSHFKT